MAKVARKEFSTALIRMLSTDRILIDKSRAGDLMLDPDSDHPSNGTTPLSEDGYKALHKVLNRLASTQQKVSLNEDDTSYLYLALPGRNDTQDEPGTRFYLNWTDPSFLDEAELRSVRVTLRRGGRGFFLNLDFNPAKFLTGQNAFGPRPTLSWLGRSVVHTPAGYVKLAWNLLWLYLGRASNKRFDLKKYADLSHTMWSRFDHADLLRCGTEEQRDRMLRILRSTARVNVLITRNGRSEELNLRTLFGLEAESDGNQTTSPTLRLKRWLPRNAANSNNGTHAYTINHYAKDEELKATDIGSAMWEHYPPEYQEALRTGIRIEFQMTPQTFSMPDVKAFIVENRWMEAPDFADTRKVTFLEALFPDADAYRERAPKIASHLWKESCASLIIGPPDLNEFRVWARAHQSENPQHPYRQVVDAWIGPNIDSPHSVPLPNAQHLHKQLGAKFSRTSVVDVFHHFYSDWRFRLNRVPPVTFPLLIQQFTIACADDDSSVRLASLFSDHRRLVLALDEATENGESDRAKDLQKKLKEVATQYEGMLRSTIRSANLNALEFRKVQRLIKPNADKKTIAV